MSCRFHRAHSYSYPSRQGISMPTRAELVSFVTVVADLVIATMRCFSPRTERISSILNKSSGRSLLDDTSLIPSVSGVLVTGSKLIKTDSY
jgi:hypothetical protein